MEYSESYVQSLKEKIEELKRDNKRLSLLLRHDDRQLHEVMGRVAVYERIAKERAQRARKGAPDHSGYVVTGCKEITDKYEQRGADGKITLLPVDAYITTVSMPYPSGLGFDELRRRLEIDLIGNGRCHLLQYNGWDGLGYRLGMDRIIEGCPVDGKHPGKEYASITDDKPLCVLYRVRINCYKPYAEADLYTTAPVYLWDDIYKPEKEETPGKDK